MPDNHMIDELARTIRIQGLEIPEPVRTPTCVSSDGDLPPIPDGAATDSVTVEIGSRKLTLFAKPAITFGRTPQLNDITLRPPATASQELLDLYRKVSREHCRFEFRNAEVIVQDGHRDGYQVLRPSTGGTYWGGERLTSALALQAGQEGTLTFGGASDEDAIALEVKVCSPASVCRECPSANCGWCGGGLHPSLVLTRLDAVRERFIALWSCLDLGNLDPCFAGSVIFRRDGGFAWRQGGMCGWLVPDTSFETEIGVASVS